MLLAGLFPALSNMNTGGGRALAHSLTWGLNLAVLTNMCHFLIHKQKKHPVRSKRPHCKKYAPCYLLMFATLLVMTDLTRHILNDNFSKVCTNIKDADEAKKMGLPAKYAGGQYCYSRPFLNEFSGDPEKLTVVGWISSVICTWLGFFLMFISIFWGIDFHRKIRMQWRNIQRNRNGGNRQQQSRDRPLLQSA